MPDPASAVDPVSAEEVLAAADFLAQLSRDNGRVSEERMKFRELSDLLVRVVESSPPAPVSE